MGETRPFSEAEITRLGLLHGKDTEQKQQQHREETARRLERGQDMVYDQAQFIADQQAQGVEVESIPDLIQTKKSEPGLRRKDREAIKARIESIYSFNPRSPSALSSIKDVVEPLEGTDAISLSKLPFAELGKLKDRLQQVVNEARALSLPDPRGNQQKNFAIVENFLKQVSREYDGLAEISAPLPPAAGADKLKEVFFDQSFGEADTLIKTEPGEEKAKEIEQMRNLIEQQTGKTPREIIRLKDEEIQKTVGGFIRELDYNSLDFFDKNIETIFSVSRSDDKFSVIHITISGDILRRTKKDAEAKKRDAAGGDLESAA